MKISQYVETLDDLDAKQFREIILVSGFTEDSDASEVLKHPNVITRAKFLASLIGFVESSRSVTGGDDHA